MWIDLSIPIRDRMIQWPGDPHVCVEQVSFLERGDEAALSRLSLGSHTGTHVDAPSHFIKGAAAVDAMPLDAMNGPARLLKLEVVHAITRRDLEPFEIEPGERLLFRTRNSDVEWFDEPFDEGFVHLTVDAAAFLAERRVRCVGIDYLSVGGFAKAAGGAEVHRLLLGAGVWILEGTYLGRAPPGRCGLVGAPLRIAHADGAPARVLIER